MGKRVWEFIKRHRGIIIKIAAIALFLGVMVWLAIQFMPFVSSLSDTAAREKLKASLQGQGVLGWLTLLGIQVMQIVVAIIPGEPIEVLSGVIYGTFGGLLTCLLGVLIGTIGIFYLTRWLGFSFVATFIKKEKFQKLKFLQNSKRLELLTFILFFIPGTPKDVLTYFAGLTPIKPLRFILIATLARIPSIITSTYAGSILLEGNIWKFVIIYGATALLAGVGILVNRFITKKLGKKDEEEAVAAQEAAMAEMEDIRIIEQAEMVQEAEEQAENEESKAVPALKYRVRIPGDIAALEKRLGYIIKAFKKLPQKVQEGLNVENRECSNPGD